MAQKLSAEMLTYRIGDADGVYEIFSGEGAKSFPGRWNDRGQAVIYTAHYYSAAMLEKLVYLGEMPPNQHFIVVKIPQGTSCEFVNPNDLPGWSDSTREQSRAFGSKWYNECRSAILVIPNVIARMENNVLITPEHEDAVQIRPEPKMPVLWDRRLFKR